MKEEQELLLTIELPALRKEYSAQRLDRCYKLLDICKDELSYNFYVSLYEELNNIKDRLK